MKTGIFLNELDSSDVSLDKKFEIVGRNTGNLLFWDALKSILDLKVISVNTPYDLNEYSAFVTTDLIWIRPNIDYSWIKHTLKRIGDRPLIPISIGLQAAKGEKNFEFHSGTLELLHELQERCTLGVRGYYTAEMLNKNGIHNIKVVGCPSMFKYMDYNLKIIKNNIEVKKVCLNFRTFYGSLKERERDFLTYGASRGYDFVEQTAYRLEDTPGSEKYTFLSKWLKENGRLFFDTAEWKDYLSKYDFTMGARFHGNVAALWSHIPALFFSVDSRTTELCEFFSLPAIEFKDFDKEKPIQYYYDMADYTEFNKVYAGKLDNFNEFLRMNNLEPIK